MENNEKNLFVFGRNSVTEALQEVEVMHLYIEKDKRNKYIPLENEAKQKNIKISFLSKDELNKLAHSEKHQGICAKIYLSDQIKWIDLKDLESYIEDKSTLLVLDGVTDTGNLGAILRSSLLFGVDAVILPVDNSARITPATIRASAGAVYQVPIYYVNNIKAFLMDIKEYDFTVCAITGEGKYLTPDHVYAKKTCFIMGAEREGIRKGVKKCADHITAIPSTRKLDSFNVSVATAVILFDHFMKQKL